MVEWLNGRYEPLETLGEGAEGRVVRALDHQHDRVVALKIRPVRSAVAREELLGEARILLSVPPHPALPLVREDFFDGDNYVIAMDWVDGTNLAKLLVDRGRPGLAPSSVLAYLAEAAEALTHLHTQDPPVIHGDVKPGNLILTRGGRVKLVDFGMSSAPDAHRRRIGTPGFRAPELAADGSPSRASDVYALAATAFALLTGSAPLGVLPSWEGVDATQAAQLEEAIRLGLATDPARRPATPGEFVERLRAGWGSALPTGVMTFCLSDIEGSTSLWDQQPNAMAQALVRHDEIISDAVENNGGRFLKSMGEGDSTVSVFDSAQKAIEAVIVVNRALAIEPWAGGLSLRVRFGIHTGEAERRGTEYFGPTLNLAGRLRSQADGGQAFVSSVTADLVASSLPEGFTVVDLGPHRMRGLQAPERVFALSGPGVDAPRAATECPYRGLLAFQAGDRDLFFGREDVIDVALERLRRSGLLATVGASGSGKSSLIRAGIAGAADAGEIPGITRAQVITPGSEPTLDVSAAPDVLVVIDQFEELFTLCGDPARRAAFMDAILELVGPVVIGLRADFYGELSTYTAMADAVSANQILLGPMTEDQLRRTITEPARLAGLKLEPGFVDVVLRDVAGEPGALPLLSHALRATWERRDGRTLTVEGYHETGGVAAALARTADSVVEAMSDEERATARRVMLRMTELGEGTQDTRRRVGIDELVTEGGSAVTVHALLERLADARLVTLDGETAEVAHEVLIRSWPTLRTWLDEDREGLRLHHRLSEASRLWDAGGREESDLYRGTRLDAANAYAELNAGSLNATERGFLDACVRRADAERRAQLRSNRRLRRSLVGVAALLVVALIAAGVAIANRSTANRRARDATTERLAFESQAIGGDDLVTSSLLAVESFRRQNSPRTRSAMLAALQAAPERSRYFGQAAPTGFGEVAITGDGHTLANVHFDGLEFYELPSGHLARERPIALTGGVGYYAVNADARSAVIGNAAGDSIELWDVVAHRRLAKLRLVGSNGTLEDVAISADGRRIALATSNKGSTPRLEILDDKLHVIAGPVSLGPSGAAVKFCPDGSLVTATIAASVHKIAVTFRRADTLQPLHRAGTMPGLGFGAAHCAHGRAVFAAFGGAVAVFDAQTGQRIGGLFGSGADAGGVMPDGSIVLVLDQNGNLQRYDINSGQAVGPTIATGLVRADLVIAPDGGRAYVGSSRIAEVALDGTAPLGTLIPGTAGAIRTSLSGDQSVAAVVAGTPENPITRFVDVHSGRILHTVAGDARYLPDGHSTFTFRTDGVASVGTPDAPASRWKAQVAHRITGETQNFFVSADGSVLAVRPDDDTLHVYDLATGRLRFAIDDPNYGFRAMTLSPTGDLVGVRRDIPSQFELLNARTGKRVGAPIGAQLGGTPFFSSDGKSLLIATRDGPIVVVDIKTRRTRPITLAGHTTNVADIVSLGDGRTIASADAGGTVRLWDLSTGVELGRPIPITYPLITPDAHWADGALYPTDRGLLIPTPAGVLDADIRPQTLLDRVCSRPGENLTPQAFTQHLPGERYHLTCSQYPPPPSG